MSKVNDKCICRQNADNKCTDTDVGGVEATRPRHCAHALRGRYCTQQVNLVLFY